MFGVGLCKTETVSLSFRMMRRTLLQLCLARRNRGIMLRWRYSMPFLNQMSRYFYMLSFLLLGEHTLSALLFFFCSSLFKTYWRSVCLPLQYDPFAEHRPQKISDREDEYKRRRQKMIISPERHDPFADGKYATIIRLHSPHLCPYWSVHCWSRCSPPLVQISCFSV